jgi:hypothetical protein
MLLESHTFLKHEGYYEGLPVHTNIYWNMRFKLSDELILYKVFNSLRNIPLHELVCCMYKTVQACVLK